MSFGKSKLTAVLLALLLLAGCGGEPEATPQLQDPAAFLGGYAAYQQNDIGSSGAGEVKFLLHHEAAAVCTQYVNALLQSGEWELLALSENDGDKLYFIGYSGKAELPMLSPADKSLPAFHVLVEVLHAASVPAVQLRVVYTAGPEFADLGYRADLSGIKSLAPEEKQENSTPVTTTPVAKPDTNTQQGSTAKPAASVSASDTYLPSLKLFLNRTPSKDEEYDGGWRQSFREVPDAHLDTVVDEIISLLEKDRYQLQLSGSEEKTVSATKYYHYYFTYNGSAAMDKLSDDDGNRYHADLFITHYTKKDYFHINFHYCSEFDVEDPGSRVSVDVSGGSSSSSGSGSSSGTADGYDPYTPDASKLQCLTCNGDGDCNSCGGKGYKIKDGIKSDCTRCSSGNCPSCGGSGTR